jgi:hypothetical protein
MKHEKLRRNGNDQLTSQVEDEADSERASADFYEQRWKVWTKLDREDWWIAVALYLVLSSVAFVVL